MSSVPAYWGPETGIDSKDYLLLVEGDSPISAPVSLLGHSLTDPSAEQSDALTVTRVKLSGGRIRTVVHTKRGAEVRSRSYTLGFPAGALWTPAMQIAISGGCRKNFYMKYLCPEDAQFNHTYIFPDGLLDEPVEAESLVTVDEENMLSETSNLTISEKLRLWAMGYNIIFTEGAGDPLYAIDFIEEDCVGCTSGVGLGMMAVGGDGVAVPTEVLTDDRFATTSTPVGGGAAAQLGVALASKGNVVVQGTSDDAAVATGATGSLHVSQDNGVNWATIAGVTAPIFGASFLGTSIIVVGGTGAGAAVAYISNDNGSSWTQVTTGLPAADALTAVAADEESSAWYAVGESGTLLKITQSGGAVTVVDLTANLPGAPGTLNAIAVLDKNHIAVGGAANYYAETIDGGVTWTQPGVPGTAAIVGIDGNAHRTVIATVDGLHVRSVESDFLYKTIVLENGQTVTGNYTAVRMNHGDDFNIFVAVTDDGEVVFGKPFYPNA